MKVRFLMESQGWVEFRVLGRCGVQLGEERE